MEHPIATAERAFAIALKTWRESDGGEDAFAAVRMAADWWASEREAAALAEIYNAARRAMESYTAASRTAAATWAEAVRP